MLQKRKPKCHYYDHMTLEFVYFLSVYISSLPGLNTKKKIQTRVQTIVLAYTFTKQYYELLYIFDLFYKRLLKQ